MRRPGEVERSERKLLLHPPRADGRYRGPALIASGDCNAHVDAWRGFLREYLRDRCREDTDSGCWHWRLSMNNRARGGIPVMSMPGSRRNITVRRLSALLAGCSPGRRVVVCSCESNDCVRPEHMVALTRRQLTKKMLADGRIGRGPTRSAKKLAAARSKPHVRLSMDIARAMRARYSELANCKAVALEFGVHHSHAHRIIRGLLWREPSPFAV
jgi:hypothetical protein